MKIIDKHNFFPVVCTVFTILVLGKVLLEAVVQGVFEKYQGNLLLMFVLSTLAILVLSQHYRFQKYPLFVVILVQYLVLIGTVMTITWISHFFEPLHEDGYKDMFWSFTIPYVIGVVVYYASLFHEISCVNKSLKNIKEHQEEYPNEK